MDDLGRLTALRGRRILVTGHSGFKGFWLSVLLSWLGAEVAGYSLPPGIDNREWSWSELEKIICQYEGDILDAHKLNRTMNEFRPELVLHLAAQSLLPRSIKDPVTTFETNIIGSLNILEACRNCPTVHSLIFVTSDKCYRNREWVWGYRENDELGGSDPYSASKAAAELVFGSYLETYYRGRPEMGAASVRAGNVIGGGDWAENRIVPDLIRSIQTGRPVSLRFPEAVRPWQHVLEPLTGYLLLALALGEDPVRYSGPWNFGPDSNSFHSVQQLAEAIVNLWGAGQIEIGPEPAGRETRFLMLNSDKARYELGWKQHWDFLQTLRKTVDWYQAVGRGEAPLTITRNQIQQYFNGELGW